MAKISTIAIWALLLIHFCEAKEFIVDQSKDNKVMFFANATLSNFSGETSHLTGHLSWDGDDTLSTSEVAFEVPLDSLDTGIGLRNHHMREKYLHTDKYPTARYRGKLVEWNAQSDSLFLVKTKGTLSIHGVDQPLTETVKMRQLKDGYRAHFIFRLNIEDFNIDQPRFLLASMKKKIAVRLIIYLRENTENR